MAAQQRKLLEQLMDTPFTEDKGLRDPDICKPYCVDFCIYELFENTRVLNGKKCTFLHREKNRLRYQSGPKIPRFEAAFDVQLVDVLQSCQARIDQGLDKLEPKEADIPRDLIDLAVKITQLGNEIDLLEAEIEVVVELDMSKALSEAQVLRDMKSRYNQLAQEFDDRHYALGSSAHQKLQVCNVCGSFLSSLDSDARLEGHYRGKMHLGYQRVREAYQARQNAAS